MKTPDDHSKGTRDDGTRKDRPVGFTMVEMVVTLGVACILMVAVVAFLVNGVVSTTKTTAINDNTAKGRYVFEHLSREMARATDINAANFTGAAPTPSPGGMGPFQGFTYNVTIEDQSYTTADTPATSSTLVLNLPQATAPDYLVPQGGDILKLPGFNGIPFTIANASGSTAGGSWTITLTAPIYVTAGCSSRDDGVAVHDRHDPAAAVLFHPEQPAGGRHRALVVSADFGPSPHDGRGQGVARGFRRNAVSVHGAFEDREHKSGGCDLLRRNEPAARQHLD